ncbi:MAG: hypothetical protein ACFE75_03965 [Candidatus Hodarchaeota archaeon]
MKFFKNKFLFVLFIIFCFSLPVYINFSNSFGNPNSIEESYIIQPQSINRTGKVFENITRNSKDCYINREFPGLNNQPNVYIPGYNISYAKMNFENITAINYTRNIEEDFSEFILSSANGPTYVYQKFAVEINQYVNNVSILIQDINDPTNFTDENSWEVAIVDCLNDTYGTPNPNEILGLLQKPHPTVFAAHWEIFDFKNSELGSLYLDITKTNMTYENGMAKYWFAIRIKIPKDDTIYGGGPKFLYFNPDGGSLENVGEGEIFAKSPDFIVDNYTVNNVKDSQVQNGTLLSGNLTSFKDIDEDRYLVTDAENVTLDIKFELKELKNSRFTFWQLYLWALKNRLDWFLNHYKYLFSIDIYLIANVSDTLLLKSANLSIYNYKLGGQWYDTGLDLRQQNETSIYYSVRDPESKLGLLYLMGNNPVFPAQNNTLRFKFEYLGTGGGNFNISINQFKVEIGELENLRTIQRYDPLIQDFYTPNGLNILNGTTTPFGNQTIESLEQTDHETFTAQALTSNISLEFTLHVLNNIDSSLWNIDYYEWIASYPNPIIPISEIRITSNVSRPQNLTQAVLEIYKGNKTFDLLDEEQNKATWLQISDVRQFANKSETTTVLSYEAGFTWIFLHLLNESENNLVKLRLRYNSSSILDYGFNVSINEFSANFYIQNAISSDISSKIGLGINNNMLTPADIKMQNFGVDVTDSGNREGVWTAEIDDASISEGYFEFNVTSLWHAIRFDVNGTYERFKIIPELEFIGSIASQYMTGTSFFSARITEAGGKPLPNFEIIFEVLGPGDGLISEVTAVSNEEGIATATLNFETTGEGYKVRVRFAEEGMYTDAEIISGDIRIVDDFILFMDNFFRFLPYAIIGVAAIATLVTVRQIRHSKLKRYWAGEAKILDDLLKTSYIMIIHKNVGVSIYSKQISLEGIDSDLISGFLQAISQFRSEIKKDSAADKGKGFEMDYGDFKIVITDGNYVRIALILDGTPSERLKESQWSFTEHFERRFGSLLADFTGDITPFREADDLVEKHFNVALVYPLQLGKHYGVIKLKGLEKTLIEVAEQIQKERKFFFISSLLNFALAGRKASRDEIISTIIDIKRKGLIIPAQINE